jgi:hypothetical protein
MSVDDARSLRQLIALCVQPEDSSLPADDADWNALLPLALAHGVAPLLHVNLKNRDLPDPIRAQLRALYVWNSIRNEVLLTEQTRLTAALSAHGVKVIPLKGPHLSELLYGDLAIRQVADIDVLIAPEDLRICDRVSSEMGFKRLVPGDIEELRGAGEFVLTKEVESIMPQGVDVSKLVPVIALDLQQRLLAYGAKDRLAQRVHKQGMTSENLLVYLCINQVAHRFARLKYLLDVAQCLQKFSASLRWSEFLAASRELDFTPGIYLSLVWAREAASAPVPDSVLAALRPGQMTRRSLSRSIGDDPLHALSRSASLDGPVGAWAILACTRPGLPRLRQFYRLLFPPAAYLRQAFSVPADAPTLPLYLRRLRDKLPAAFRSSR